jgi:hypothetical protein
MAQSFPKTNRFLKVFCLFRPNRWADHCSQLVNPLVLNEGYNFHFWWISSSTANVGTEGAAENFPIWTDFRFRDRFAFISRVSGWIIMVYSAFCQNNSSTISDRARFSKYQFISATWHGVPVWVQCVLACQVRLQSGWIFGRVDCQLFRRGK